MLIAILLSIIPIILVILIFVFGFSWYIARTSLKPIKIPNQQTPSDYNLEFETFSIENDGLNLTGWFIPAIRNRKKSATIILSHGWSANAESMLPYCKHLHGAGFHTVVYDLRGHGDSDAVAITSLNRMRDDLHQVLNYAMSRREVDTKAIGLLGHSIGASASILVAAAEPRVKALVSSASFADFSYLAAQTLRMRGLPRFPFTHLLTYFWEKTVGLKLESLSPIEKIAEVNSAILFLHGEKDKTILLQEFDKLSERVPDAEKELIKGRAHSDLFEDENYFLKIKQFLNRQFLTSDD